MKKILLSVLALLAFAGSGFSQNLPSYVPANGLVGWWPFNGNANDESGNNNNGTVNGTALTTDRFGNQGKAFDFDGVDDFIEVLHNSNFIFPENKQSISFWVELPVIPTPSSLEAVMSKYTQLSGTISGFTIHFAGNSNLFYSIKNSTGPIWGDCYIDSSNFSPSGLFYHFVFTNDNTIQKCFVNGVLKAENIIPSNTSIGQNTSNFLLGKENTMANVDFLKGKLDDIAIYNRALTQQEITGLYQGANTTTNCPTFPASLAQGLVGYWPFCGNANDESGNGNNGTVNGATLTTDRFGSPNSSYSFNGTSSSIKVNYNSIFTAYPLTLSAWVKTSSSQRGGIVNRYEGCLNNGYAITQGLFGEASAYYYSQNGSYVNLDAPDIFTINNNSWRLIAVVFSNDSAYLYSNNVLFEKYPFSTANPNASSTTTDLYFGKMLGGSCPPDLYFSGSLDDIAIWNRALSQSEITQLYNQGICQTSITVTDTLLIHTGITSYNPVAYGNTLKVWPNPGNQDITLDAGNLNSMQGWKYKVANTLGQTVVNETAISQQQTMIDLSNWGGNGIYYLHLINPQGHAIEIKKIVLAP